MDITKWEEDLNADRNILEELLFSVDEIKGGKDLKLSKLKENIAAKINNPINLGNHKIIVFTAFGRYCQLPL